ncbi:hypothetical protein J7M00_00315 [bacterium]|nr:hypothetical protein [bacterium]
MKRKLKKAKRFVSVLRIQKLPPEKVVELMNDVNEGRAVLLSVYSSRISQIFLSSDVLKNFVRDMQETRVSAMNKLMRKLSRRWYNEDQEGISSQKKRMDKKELSKSSPPGFHSKKML